MRDQQQSRRGHQLRKPLRTEATSRRSQEAWPQARNTTARGHLSLTNEFEAATLPPRDGLDRAPHSSPPVGPDELGMGEQGSDHPHADTATHT
jgi:hypothetical protein